MSQQFYTSQTVPLPTDTQRILLAKTLLATSAGTSATLCISGGIGPPTGTPPCKFSVYIQQPGPNFGLWLGDSVTGWASVLAQGP